MAQRSRRALCVAEKPSVAKGMAIILGNGQAQNRGKNFYCNYMLDNEQFELVITRSVKPCDIYLAHCRSCSIGDGDFNCCACNFESYINVFAIQK